MYIKLLLDKMYIFAEINSKLRLDEQTPGCITQQLFHW